jgi:hypothetical protein
MARSALSLEVKRRSREADYSLSSHAEVKNGGDITLPLHTPSWHDVWTNEEMGFDSWREQNFSSSP